LAAAVNNPYKDDTGYQPRGVTLALADPHTVDNAYENVAAGYKLGIHEHNFGIVKYDSNYTIGNYTGIDNWETNWADDIRDEYDVDINIITTRDFENLVRDARNTVNSENIEDYKALANRYEKYYKTMRKVISGEIETDNEDYIMLKEKMVTGYTGSKLSSETADSNFGISPTEWNNYRVAQKNLDAYLKSLDGKATGDKTPFENMSQEIEYETTYHRYSDFYSLLASNGFLTKSGGEYRYAESYEESYVDTSDDDTIKTKTSTGISGYKEGVVDEFSRHYQYWRNAKIYEQYFYKMFIKYRMYATMKDIDTDLEDDVHDYLPDFTEVYDCIVIGAGHWFGKDDISNADKALDAINMYIDDGGNTFIFNRTINDEATVSMTKELKNSFGQNYRHPSDKTMNYKVLDTETETDTGLDVIKYNDDGSAKYKTLSVSGNKVYRSSPLLKSGDTINVSENHLTWYNAGALSTNGWDSANMYRLSAWKAAYAGDTDPQNKQIKAGTPNVYTNRASQVNKGIVTLYPFLISSELKISGTLPGSYSTDIEDDDMVVYYTLAGGANAEKTHATRSAASPHDGIDQYFLYSYGNVTYCGAGHSNITGPGRDNNDERRLFINVILKSTQKSLLLPDDPKVQVFDYDTPQVEGSETNNVVTKAGDGQYLYLVDGKTSDPEFTFKINIPDENDEVDSVRIYYDLTPNKPKFDEDDDEVDKNYWLCEEGEEINKKLYKDVIIYSRSSEQDPSILKDNYRQIANNANHNTLYVDAKLKLNSEYFEPRNDQEAVLVVAVKTKKGTYVKSEITIRIKPRLWDLT
jgi:hypothetical protein